jgi:hypothetical protein
LPVPRATPGDAQENKVAFMFRYYTLFNSNETQRRQQKVRQAKHCFTATYYKYN